ncbi:MAG: S16 family serine protease [Nitrospiraceae bacterium]
MSVPTVASLLSRPTRISISALVALLSVMLLAPATGLPASDSVVEIPLLAMIGANDRGVFEVMIIQWDRKPEPDPIALEWRKTRIKFLPAYIQALNTAIQYAKERTPSVRHTGTLWVHGVAYGPTSTDGPSAGAAMAVGFIAAFKGDTIRRGIALTGTIEADGRIGSVGAIPDKVRAAAREGCRTILIPQGQFSDPRWHLADLGLELNVTIKEVGTIEAAYELMTGRSL